MLTCWDKWRGSFMAIHVECAAPLHYNANTRKSTKGCFFLRSLSGPPEIAAYRSDLQGVPAQQGIIWVGCFFPTGSDGFACSAEEGSWSIRGTTWRTWTYSGGCVPFCFAWLTPNLGSLGLQLLRTMTMFFIDLLLKKPFQNA